MGVNPVSITLNLDNTKVDIQGRAYNVVVNVSLENIWEGIIVGDSTMKYIYIEVYISIPIIEEQEKRFIEDIYVTQSFKVSNIQDKTVEIEGYFAGTYDTSASRNIIASAKVWQYSIVPYTEEE